MLMENLVCLPARGALLRFLSSRTDEYRETEDRARWSTARQRADSSSVFLALRVTPWVRVLSWHATTTNNSSLALGDDGVWAKTACRTFDRLDCGDGCDFLIDGSCSRRRWQENPCRTSRSLLVGACTRSCTVSVRKNPPWNCVFVNEDGYPYLIRFGLLLCL